LRFGVVVHRCRLKEECRPGPGSKLRLHYI
jgi:hypothetical protein